MTRRVILPFYIPPRVCSPNCIFCHPAAGRPDEGGLPDVTTLERELRAFSEVEVDQPIEVAFYGCPLDYEASEVLRLLEVLRPWLDAGRVRGVRLCGRPDHFITERVVALAAAGVNIIEMDVASLCEPVLSQMGPAHVLSRVEDAVAAMRDSGLQIGMQLRPGLPGSYLEQELMGLERVIALHPGFVRIHPALVLKNTWLERLMLQGRYRPMSLEVAVRTCRLLMERLESEEIPVIRVGLQPMRDLGLERDCVAAGPFHPALRTLIDSEQMYERAAEVLRSRLFPGRHVTFRVSPTNESKLRGPENCNLERLRRRFHCASVSVWANPTLGPEELDVEFSMSRQRFAS